MPGTHNIALELLLIPRSKFFEHFIAICEARNHLDGHGLWDETDGFYYDSLRLDGNAQPLKGRHELCAAAITIGSAIHGGADSTFCVASAEARHAAAAAWI